MEKPKLKVLNLYAGIGGNRKLWTEVDVTAIEINEDIAGVYRSFFPNDKVIIGDAHQYLLDHYKEFDFIWASPPCQSHSKMNFSLRQKTYPSMHMYQEIIFLQTWFKGKFALENVIPYYPPLIKPTVELVRHYFWSNFSISKKDFPEKIDITRCSIKELSDYLGIDIPNCRNFATVLRNCVIPEIGLHILNCATKGGQLQLLSALPSATLQES